MSDKLAQALISHCDSVFYGPNGDYAAVLEAVEKVTAEQAMWKPSPNQNSIWQIVEHLLASKDWLVVMVETGKILPMVWTDPTGNESDWQATLERLKQAHARLKQCLEKLSDETLLAIADAKSGQTLLQLILSSGPAHEAHHSGQLDYLRGLLVNGRPLG